ncbi:MAG: insulinase family protein [Spirochaetaceae bacterium]|jgi:Zn-dependent M16 (insulinase) family peptidase|nr:insulinase family protein [Spirochaetaceae bacterium]
MSSFEKIQQIELSEFKAAGIWMRHKSGAEVFHLYNDDEENLFAFVFATAAKNSKGVAHILEHSVLCGSKNYPLKDPFIVLAQGSLQTYLNAWTFPDKTVYPASSLNESDYFNLMSVYGDAVFRPNLEEWTFRQEGHRLEFSRNARDTGRIIRNGIVYNEMKGSYSAFEEYVQNWAARSVMPDTIYACDSGGDPDFIPDLTYNEFCSFHREFYSPANCRIFLCGNIPTEKQLDFLDERFLSPLAAGQRAPKITLQPRWEEPKRFYVPAPKEPDGKAAIFVSWLCGRKSGEPSMHELFLLTEALLGHDGSPLKKALISSGLGEDLAIVSGLETELHEELFCAGLQGVSAGTEPEKIESIVMDELSRLCREGIPPEETEAALHSLEFSNREIRRAGGPWSLVLMRRALRGWLHGSAPWDTLVFEAPFNSLKSELKTNPHLVEKLIEERLLKNSHRALVCVQPEDDFLKKQEEERRKKLLTLANSLSFKDRRVIAKQNRELKNKQSKPDSPAALAKIPHIARENLSCSVEKIPLEIVEAGGAPLAVTRLWTNGVTYFNFAFPADIFDSNDYIYLPLLCHVIPALGLPGMDYAKVSSLLANCAGGFFASPHISHTPYGTSPLLETPCGTLPLVGRDWIIFNLKCLFEKQEKALEIVLALIRDADFSDERRLGDLILEYKNIIESNLAPNGSSYASLRASSFLNPARLKLEIISGITQFKFAKQLSTGNIAEIAQKLKQMRDKLISNTPFIHICGEKEDESVKLAGSENWKSQNGTAEQEKERFVFTLPDYITLDTLEVFSSPALQVGFCAMSFEALEYLDPAQVYEQALAHYLSTGVLWETFRMKGGAYGARCSISPIERAWTFSTYRDPSPGASLKIFPDVLKRFSRTELSEAALGKLITGCYAKLKQPLTGAQKGFSEFCRLLCGIKHEMRLQRMKTLLSISGIDVTDAAKGILRRGGMARRVIICSPGEAQTIAKKQGCTVQNLD